jgi:peptide/nickel transport system substrate-binding protein
MIAPERGTSTRRRWQRLGGRLFGPCGATPFGAAMFGATIFTMVFGATMLGGCTPPARPPATAVIASGTDLESGNPLVTVHTLSRQVQRHALFVTLVRLDSLLKPEPYFARRWEWSEDHHTVTMHLDSTLRWHDGVPTTAADVAFTIAAAQDSALGAPRRADALAIESVSVINAHTVRLRFRAAPVSLPLLLAELPLVPQHLLGTVPTNSWRTHAFAMAPVGNGPFRFVSRQAGRQWRFARNEQFPQAMGGPPALAQLVVAVVDEAATKFAGLVSGELDMAGVSPTMARLVADDRALALVTPPALFSTIMAFNVRRGPLQDVRVRQALALAVNRPRLVDAAVAGYGTPATSAIPPGLPVSPIPAKLSRERVASDRRRADSLLTAAGLVRAAGGGPRLYQGRPWKPTLITVGSGDMAIEQLLQADLASQGIEVTIRVLELATFLATVRASDKQFELAVTGIPGDLGLSHLAAMFSSTQQGGALDYTGYRDAALDRALLEARTSRFEDAPLAWRVVDERLQAAAPVAWLYHARGVQGRSRQLNGVVMDLRGELVSVARWHRP